MVQWTRRLKPQAIIVGSSDFLRDDNLLKLSPYIVYPVNSAKPENLHPTACLSYRRNNFLFLGLTKRLPGPLSN